MTITVLFGAQGTGKTNCATYIARRDGRALIFDRHNEYGKDLDRVLAISTPEQLERCLGAVLSKHKGKMIIIDEANLYFPELFWTQPGARYRTSFVETGRHGNFRRVFIARRPATLSKQIVDQANEIYIFKLHGKNDYSALANIHEAIPDMVRNLQQYQFVYFERHALPVVVNPIPKQ